MRSFRNPISSISAPDPFITYDKRTGYYYALFTRGNTLELFRSRHADSIVSDGDSRIIYTLNGEQDDIWGDIWAPEMHRGSDGKWYIYTSGRAKENPSTYKCLFIMEGPSADPFEGDWVFRCKPAPDLYAIDPTVYTAKDGKQYICYSRIITGELELEICDLVNPYTMGENKAMIAQAELDWELMPPYVGRSSIVEGPFFLENQGRLFIIYSANGCWSNHYSLGVLEHTGGSLCDAKNWKKSPKPLLVYGNGVYGPGHASFFYSPDGSEVWCAFHGMNESNDTVSPVPRYIHLQKVCFDESGYPVMGTPVGCDVDLIAPAGELD